MGQGAMTIIERRWLTHLQKSSLRLRPMLPWLEEMGELFHGQFNRKVQPKHSRGYVLCLIWLPPLSANLPNLFESPGLPTGSEKRDWGRILELALFWLPGIFYPSQVLLNPLKESVRPVFWPLLIYMLSIMIMGLQVPLCTTIFK